MVHYLRAEWCSAERRACGLVSLEPLERVGTYRGGAATRSCAERLRELAGERRRFGYRRLHVMLRGKVRW